MRKDPVKKITFTGLLLALTIIVTRVFSVSSLPIIPFVRLSLGPIFIIFSSLFLGPLCGAVVGGGSDILGILLFPDKLGYAINPLFTVVYTLLGIVPWVVFQLVKKIKSEKVLFLVIALTCTTLFGGAVAVLLCNDTFVFISSEISLNIVEKLSIIGVLLVFFVFFLSFIKVSNNRFKQLNSENIGLPYKVGFTSLVSELLVFVVLNSIIKSFYFDVNFFFILLAQIIVFFIDVPIGTFLISYLLKFTARFKKL